MASFPQLSCSSLLTPRRISPKPATGTFSNPIPAKFSGGYAPGNSTRLSVKSPNFLGARFRPMNVLHAPLLSTPWKSSPWLMLPPGSEGNDMVYKFYSLAEDKVLTVPKRGGAGEVPPDDSQLVGSSHGWLALFNERNGDIFLSNPLSRRHIKLPSLNTLDLKPAEIESDYEEVVSVIISSSPDEEQCRAVMIFNGFAKLAFCCPNRSSKWTPIGDYGYLEGEWFSAYQQCVYSRREKVFFCVKGNGLRFEAWDLRDPQSPKMNVLFEEEENVDGYGHDDGLYSHRYKFLVVTDEHILLVTRRIAEAVYRDGSYVRTFDGDLHDCGGDGDECVLFQNCFPHKTLDFHVHKYDPEKKIFGYMKRSLNGLAIFIGLNHAFALETTNFPELKPNSIYYTDIIDFLEYDWCDRLFGGHDIGIFDYESKTFSPCYYPCDLTTIKRIKPAPMWFTPSPL